MSTNITNMTNLQDSNSQYLAKDTTGASFSLFALNDCTVEDKVDKTGTNPLYFPGESIIFSVIIDNTLTIAITDPKLEGTIDHSKITITGYKRPGDAITVPYAPTTNAISIPITSIPASAVDFTVEIYGTIASIY